MRLWNMINKWNNERVVSELEKVLKLRLKCKIRFFVHRAINEILYNYNQTKKGNSSDYF